MLKVSQLTGFNVGGDNVKAVYSSQPLSEADSGTETNTHTFNTMAIGNPHPRRLVIVCVHYGGLGTTGSLSSATIGGIAATIVRNSYATEAFGAAIITAVVPTGTTASIVLNFSANTGGAAVEVYAAKNLISNTAFDNEGNTRTTDGSTTNSIDVPADGVLVGCGTGDPFDTVQTWTGLTTDLSQDQDTVGNLFEGRRSSGIMDHQSVQTGKTVSVNWASTFGSAQAVATWQ